MLYDGNVGFAEKVRHTKDNRVGLYGAPYTNHDILRMRRLLGWSKDANDATCAAFEFLKREADLAAH